MKKTLAIILALCLAFSMVPVVAMAAEADVTGTCGDNIEWALDTETKTLTLTGTGATYDYVNVGDVNPFIEHRADIETIVIGDGITRLGNRLFRGVTQATTVTFGADVESMGYEVFYSCLKLADVTLNDGLTAIGSLTFYSCKALDSIEIPETVTTIDNRAFKLCTALTEIVIPDSVTYMGYEVFMGDTALADVTYTNSGCMINSLDFKDCTALVEFTVPANVNRVRTSAFADSGLQKIFFTDERSLTPSSDGLAARMASNSFENCDGLTMYSPYHDWVEWYCDRYGFNFVCTTSYLNYEDVGDYTVNTTVIATAEDPAAVKAKNAGVNVTIEGGEYNTAANENAATIYARDGATITINDGTFTAAEGAAVVYAKNNATVYINGGYFEAKGPYNDTYFVLNLADNTDSQIIVTGGTFVNFDPSNANTEPGDPVSFVADGYTVIAEEQANGDVWYTVVEEGSIAASIGSNYYTSLEDAVAAAKDGDEIVLQKNVALTATILVYEDITLDLNGNTISAASAYHIGDGYNESLLCVKRGAHLTINDSVGTGVMDASNIRIALNLTQYKDSSTGECAALTINGGKYIGGEYFVIAGNGSRDNTYLEINGGEFISNGWDAIYHPQNGEIIINGGRFVGKSYSAVCIYSATNVEINGGTFECVDDALYFANFADSTDPATYQNIDAIKVTGGTFIAGNGSALVFEDAGGGIINNFVTGGKFNTTIDAALIAEGYVLTDNGDGTYSVVEKGPTAVSDAESLAAALSEGGNIVLSSDVELSATVVVPADVETVLDLNGNTLSYTNNVAAASSAIENKGNLTIKNGTVTYQGVGDTENVNATNTITNSGNLTIDGATIINTTETGSSYAIDNTPDSKLVVNSGTIKSEMIAIRVQDGSEATIKGGDITSNNSYAVIIHVMNGKAANLTINGGTLTSNADDAKCFALYSYAHGNNTFAGTTVTITGGTFNGYVAFGGGNKTEQETVNITGGTFNSDLGRFLENGGWQDIAKP